MTNPDLSTKTERVMSELSEMKDPGVAVQLARIEEQMKGMRGSNDALGKQFESIDKKWDDRFTRLDNTHGDTKEKVNRIFWFSSGVSFVGTILLALVIWVLSNEMQKTQRHDARIDYIELHLATDPLRPYRPR